MAQEQERGGPLRSESLHDRWVIAVLLVSIASCFFAWIYNPDSLYESRFVSLLPAIPFGFIALIMAVDLHIRSFKSEEVRNEGSREKKQCPYCAELIQSEAKAMPLLPKERLNRT